MAAIVTFFPDVCSAQAGMSLTGAVAVCAKVTEGIEYSAQVAQRTPLKKHGTGPRQKFAV